MNTSKRLVSIDLLRGLTVMLMIFVNNGAGDHIYATLQHSKWNGMTLADVVFPSFLFIMGMSTYLSLRKFSFHWSRPVAKKVFKRAVLLFLIGLGLNWLDMIFDGRPLDFAHLRIWGVMQRLGICYLLTAVLALSIHRPVNKRGIDVGFVSIIIVGLVAYSAILLLGHGYDYNAQTNVLARVDNGLFGWNHLYHKSPVDPEGLVSTLSATLHCMIGFVVMEALAALSKEMQKMKFCLMLAFAFLVVGCILSQWLPLNKRVWSTSYVFMSIGCVLALLGLLIYFVDMHGDASATKRYPLLKSFGMNPLALYVGSEVLSIVFGALGIKDDAFHLINSVVTNASWAGFNYAFFFTAIFAVMGLVMYRKRIFIKL
ncbi:MAG: acyltransferase family protein [Prevotella sp.]